MTRQFVVVVEKYSDGYFVTRVPALKRCHTQARSPGELMPRIYKAAEVCLEVQGSPPTSLDFVGVQRITVGA